MNVNLNNTDNNDYVRGYKDGKIAGATAEHDRTQALLDALSDIASGKVLPQFIASMALIQWKSGKGKEVEVGDE